MKTINIVLPIYDRLIKQPYERSKHAGIDDPVPVISARHHLPAWQYNVETTVVGAVTKIELVNREGVATDITTYFPTLSDDVTVGTDTYYKYDGDTLNYLLPAGLFYLQITHANGYVYYSDWILVDCVYTNVIDSWQYHTYDTYTISGTAIVSAVQTTAGSKVMQTSYFTTYIGETINILFNFHQVSGQKPTFWFSDGTATQTITFAEGANQLTVTTVRDSTQCSFNFMNDAASSWSITEFFVYRNYSEKYLKLAFEHSCDLGEITYDDGFSQVLYLETETMEPTFPYTEKGQENGYGQFVPTFQRQDKLYLIRTGLIPQFIVDVLHRLKLHDTVTLTDLVGDSWTVKEIDTEHEWQFQDRYYAIATITVNLGEGIVVTGCCTAINECE